MERSEIRERPIGWPKSILWIFRAAFPDFANASSGLRFPAAITEPFCALPRPTVVGKYVLYKQLPGMRGLRVNSRLDRFTYVPASR